MAEYFRWITLDGQLFLKEFLLYDADFDCI